MTKREIYLNTKTRGVHKTKRGVIRYPDKRKRKFGLMDVIRLITRINNQTVSSEGIDGIVKQVVQWRAIHSISYRNYKAAIDAEEEKNGSRLQDTAAKFKDSAGEQFEQWLQGFDIFVNIGQKLLGDVPGAGGIVNVVSEFYRFVRRYFPVR